MPAKWTTEETVQKRLELEKLYINQNKTIFEVAEILGIDYRSVFKRLKRLGVPSCPEQKIKYLNKRGGNDIKIPQNYSENLAEFIGVILGDGHISPTQVIVTVNNNEESYLIYLTKLMTNLFSVVPRIWRTHLIHSSRYQVSDIYIGSVDLVRYLLKMGMASNKVKQQVDIPSWVQENKKYAVAFLRGFFDTDGSIYKLKFGVQAAYKNASMPLLNSTRELLIWLGFNPSEVSNQAVYLTRRKDLFRFFIEIQPKNQKHIERAKLFGVI